MMRRAHTKLARQLRQRTNVSEDASWETLRQCRALGFAVRRQHAIGRCIADFAIAKARLVTEVDGGIHELESVADRDDARDLELMRSGWRVLRVDGATAMSADHLTALPHNALGLARRPTPSLPAPLPQSGRGEKGVHG
jgi:very-short-patch-repair endonuclease